MTFKELNVGDVFEFDRSDLEKALGYPCGLALGSWRKLSARTYVPVDNRWHGEHTKVGSVNVKVVRED